MDDGPLRGGQRAPHGQDADLKGIEWRRTARISTPVEAATQPTVVVPVVFDDGVAFIAESVPIERGRPRHPADALQGVVRETGSQARGRERRACCARRRTRTSRSSVSARPYNSLEAYRLAGAAAARCAGDESVAFFLPTDGIDDPLDAAQALVTGALLASYKYKADDAATTLRRRAAAARRCRRSRPTTTSPKACVAARRSPSGVNWAKFLIDSPAGYMPPKELARQVQTRLEDEHVTVEVWSEPRIREERLGGLLGRGRGLGAALSTGLRHLRPESRRRSCPTSCSSARGSPSTPAGSRLKTGEGMMAMKTDMTGAAVVMAALSIASRLALT